MELSKTLVAILTRGSITEQEIKSKDQGDVDAFIELGCIFGMLAYFASISVRDFHRVDDTLEIMDSLANDDAVLDTLLDIGIETINALINDIGEEALAEFTAEEYEAQLIAIGQQVASDLKAKVNFDELVELAIK